MGRIHYGTSSWSEKSWVGPFYPDGARPAEFLTHYAEQFETVEADNTYYAIPRDSVVDGWAAKTPERFTMAAKFPRSIVHGGEGPRPDGESVLLPERVWGETEEFLAVMRRLGKKCGPLVLQFPYFNRSAFAGPEPFLERLDVYLGKLPGDFRYAVEVRNKGWVTPALTGVLRRHRAALVLVDIAYMPHPASLAKSMDVVTADFVYCRLIGDRKAVDEKTKTFDRIVLDQGRRLDRWADPLHQIADAAPEIYVYANNHYAGHGPATIRELRDRIEGE
ncbi:MAG: DUF72 domain-containing protein [Planctomycetota bacterium]